MHVNGSSGKAESYCCSRSGPKAATLCQLSLSDLQAADFGAMRDRGFQRFGNFVRCTNQLVSCCPQFIMRVDVIDFKHSKSQKKLLRRWQQFIDGVRDPEDDGTMDEEMMHKHDGKSDAKEVPKKQGKKRKFEMKMEEPMYSKAKGDLMRKYTGYGEGMLANLWCKKGVSKSVLKNGDNELELGSKHLCYYIDDELIGCAVVDVLPTMITSLYFFYDPYYKRYGFGILSVLKEIEYVKTHSVHFPEFRYENLGLFSPTHHAMIYKSQFKPYQLLCPFSMTYVTSDGHPQREKHGDNRLCSENIDKKNNNHEFDDIKDMRVYVSDKCQIDIEGTMMMIRDLPDKLKTQILVYMEGYFMAVGKALAPKLLLRIDDD